MAYWILAILLFCSRDARLLQMAGAADIPDARAPPSPAFSASATSQTVTTQIQLPEQLKGRRLIQRSPQITPLQKVMAAAGADDSGVWLSVDGTKTVTVTTAPVGSPCGAAHMTRSVCKTPAAVCSSKSPGKSTCHAVPKVEEISTISEQTGTGVWLSSDASRTIFITTASMNSRCGAAFGTRTVCPDGGHCTRAGGYSTCSQSTTSSSPISSPTSIATVSEETEAGVWLSSDASRTVTITTASANDRCGAQYGTRTLCPGQHVCTTVASQGYSTCASVPVDTETSVSSDPTQVPTGVWASIAPSTTIYISTASWGGRCGAQFGTRTVCPVNGRCTSVIGKGISTCTSTTNVASSVTTSPVLEVTTNPITPATSATSLSTSPSKPSSSTNESSSSSVTSSTSTSGTAITSVISSSTTNSSSPTSSGSPSSSSKPSPTTTSSASLNTVISSSTPSSSKSSTNTTPSTTVSSSSSSRSSTSTTDSPRSSTSANPSTSISSPTTSSVFISSSTSSNPTSSPSSRLTSVTTTTVAPGASSQATSASIPTQTITRPTPGVRDTFLVGASIGTVPRLEALPGRQFMDYNGTRAIDPMEYAGAAGMNVARVSTFMETCSGPTLSFNNSAGWPEREKLYTLDWGCIDLQVSVALRAQSMSMKIVHAINMGQILPLAWSNLTYVEMLAKIAEETERQVRPFLDAGIQADFFILGTEESDGMLFRLIDPETGAITNERGVPSATKSSQTLQSELCGLVPTGNLASWPQLAGYYKHMAATIKALLVSTQRDPERSLIGLHSHGQYFAFKNNIVYNGIRSETSVRTGGMTCDLVNIIPASLYVQSASDVLDVMGWSGYPNPMHVTDLDGPGMVSAMARINANLASSKKVAEKYGRGNDGKYIKVALILETAEAYSYPAEEAIQDAFTHAFFARLLTEEYLLGVLYYEPMYARAYFEGGKAAFYTEDGLYKVFAKRTAQTFYSYAGAPWALSTVS